MRWGRYSSSSVFSLNGWTQITFEHITPDSSCVGLIDNCLLFLLVEVGHTAVLHASEHGHKELLELLVDKYKCPPRSRLEVCAVGDSLAKPYIFNVNVLSIYHNMATLMCVSTSYYTLSLPYCVYCSRPEGECSKQSNMAERACSKWLIAK